MMAEGTTAIDLGIDASTDEEGVGGEEAVRGGEWLLTPYPSPARSAQRLRRGPDQLGRGETVTAGPSPKSTGQRDGAKVLITRTASA